MPNFVRDDFWPSSSSSSSPSDEQQQQQQVSTSSLSQSTISMSNSTTTTPNLQLLLADAFSLATVILPVAFNILQYCYYFSIIIEADHRKMKVQGEDVVYSSIPNMTDFIILNNEKKKDEESLFEIIRNNSGCLDEVESSSLLLCSTKSEILDSKKILRDVLNKKGVTTTENGDEDLSCSAEETSSTKNVLREMVKEMKSENTTFLNTTLRHIVKNIENIARWRKFEVPVVNDEEENKNYNYNDDSASSSSPSTMTEAVSVTTISGIGEETKKKKHQNQKQLPNNPEEITLLLFRELINEYFVPICDTIANINTAATTTTNFCLHHAAPFISDYLLQTVALAILYPYLGMPLWMKRWMVVVFTGSMITTTATSSNIQEVVDTTSTSTIENAGNSNNMLSLLWRKLTSSLVTGSASTTTTGTSSVAGESSSSPSDREQDQETCFLVFSISIVLLILLGIVHLRFKKYIKTLTV